MALRVVPLEWVEAYAGAGLDGTGLVISLVNAGNYRGTLGTIDQTGWWRADRQRKPKDKTNIQIQRNGAANPSTIACVLIPDALGDLVGAPERPGFHARFHELTAAIHRGLSLSVGSREQYPDAPTRFRVRVYEVDGELSSAERR